MGSDLPKLRILGVDHYAIEIEEMIKAQVAIDDVEYEFDEISDDDISVDETFGVSLDLVLVPGRRF